MINGEIKTNLTKAERIREGIDIAIGYFGAMLCLYGLSLANKHLFPELALGARIPLSFILYWLVSAVPRLILMIRRDRLKTLELDKGSLLKQALIGLALGAALFIVLELVPILAKIENNGSRYTKLWHFVYEFFYTMLCVGLVEEFIFRAFIYEKLERVSGSTAIAVIGSSLLFGLFHIFASGGILQIIMTAFIGAVFCLFRLKIKGFTFLSLVIMHGFYDFLISVGSSIINAQ